MLIHCDQWCDMVTKNWVDIGSGNDFVSDGTKPLPEPNTDLSIGTCAIHLSMMAQEML